MRLTFDNPELEILFHDSNARTRYSKAIVKAFRQLIARVIDATNENHLRDLKGLHFEKLKGRKGEYSMRLNKQFRLIVTIESASGGNVLHILDIEDYH